MDGKAVGRPAVEAHLVRGTGITQEGLDLDAALEADELVGLLRYALVSPATSNPDLLALRIEPQMKKKRGAAVGGKLSEMGNGKYEVGDNSEERK